MISPSSPLLWLLVKDAYIFSTSFVFVVVIITRATDHGIRYLVPAVRLYMETVA